MGLRLRALVAGALLLVLSWTTPGAHAAGTVTPVGGPGRTTGSPPAWTTDRFANFYSHSITGESFSSAAVGDVYGDGRQVVVAGFPDGTVYGWNIPDGSRAFKFVTGPGAVQASPALVDLNGDGVLDILAANTAGDVVGFTPSGRVLFRAHDDCSRFCGIFGTPTVADLNRDGRREVIASSWNEYIYAWHIDDGSLAAGWPFHVGDSSWSSPSVADLDGDGYPEVVVGGDCDGVAGQRCTPQRGGYIWVIRHDGKLQPGFPYFSNGQVVWSSPAIADLNGDGALDIVVGTGTNMDPPAGNNVFAVDRNGHNLPGWPTHPGGRVMGSPSIGDLNGDGRFDVVVPADDGRIYAWDPSGHLLPGWPRCNANDTNACPIPVHGSVALADVMGTGRPQVIHGGEQYMRILDSDGTMMANLETIGGTSPMSANAAVASINGQAWIFEAVGWASQNNPPPDYGGVWVWHTDHALGVAPWPTFKQNFARRGTAVGLPTGPVTNAPPATTRTTARRAPAGGTRATTAATAAPTTTSTSEEITSTTSTTSPVSRVAAPRTRSGKGSFPVVPVAVATIGVVASIALVIKRWLGGAA